MTDTRDTFPTDTDQLDVTGEVAAATAFTEEVIHEAPAAAARSPRTMRILLAALVVVAAGFVWFNFFALPDNEQSVASPVPLPGSRTAATEPAVEATAPEAAAVDAAVEAAAVDAAVTALPLIAADVAAEVAADVAVDGNLLVAGAPGVARQLVISELPFLVTAAPLAAEPEVADTAAEITRPALQRVSVNPFTPVVLHEVLAATPQLPDFPAAESDTLAESAQPDVINVPVPAAPPQATVPRTVTVDGAVQPPAAPTVMATIPAPMQSAPVQSTIAASVAPPVAAPVTAAVQPAPVSQAPAASSSVAAVRNLPRALPGGSLSPAPRLLQERRAIEDIPTPNLAQLATVQEPEPVMSHPQTAPVLRSDDSLAAVPEPQPLPPTALAASGVPLAAGITPLSRYLRDNNVEFTGSVLGPVSVGVFHTSLTSAAIVISLGQSLPDTSIVLTDLRGQQAELTLGEASQILSMELRR